ncbi:MAG: GNAT family N-acetyltransferase [Ignavibacteriaceae bacterium]|nr:GNAT family N-acetyltransferase [Ignavibacteriaceae bacterium]
MIRPFKPSDREQILDMLKRIEQFNRDDVSIAMELIDIAVSLPSQRDYNIFVCEEERILGYHCTGRRPLTDGVYDLYWIVADPSAGKKGIGTLLLNHAEEFVKSENGRLILAETSSRDIYAGTRNFYLKNNYELLAEIKHFYTVGESLMVFGKYFRLN